MDAEWKKGHYLFQTRTKYSEVPYCTRTTLKQLRETLATDWDTVDMDRVFAQTLESIITEGPNLHDDLTSYS